MESKPSAAPLGLASVERNLIDEAPRGAPGFDGRPVFEEQSERLERVLSVLVDQQREVLTALATLAARIGPAAAPARAGGSENGAAAAAPAGPRPQASAIVALLAAIEADPKDAKAHTDLGQILMTDKRFAEAETLFRAALELTPRVPSAYTNVATSLVRQGRPQEAIPIYRAALEVDPACRARGLLAEVLVKLQRLDEAQALWLEEVEAAPHDPAPLRELVGIAFRAHRLEDAAAYARRFAIARWGTRFWPERRSDDPPLARAFNALLKAPKLRHDIEQLTYLQQHGLMGDEATPILEACQRALERIAPFGDVAMTALSQAERLSIGALYGRIIHLGHAPRVAKALSYDWDMAAIEDDYIENRPGIVFVDRLLSDEALQSLRRFCLESTVWSANRYDNGYLGGFLGDGFNCPLLFQIAEELRAAMPRVIGDRRVSTMWGFKYDQHMTGINIHADQAAVNVNFWLTPDDANLDPESGGLIVHDKEAPQDWDFAAYNAGTSGDRIRAFLRESNARPVSFAHRQNRAVIFNSDLFHQTAPYRFKPGYENRRINITMLFGAREDQRIEVTQRPEPAGHFARVYQKPTY